MAEQRLLISLGILLLVALSPMLVQRYQQRILSRPVRAAAKVSMAKLQRAQSPTILYFSTPECAQCLLQQAPALEAVQREFGDLLIVQHIDARKFPELVSQYSVMTVPTTILLDRDGQAVHINYGLALAPKLRSQLKAITRI